MANETKANTLILKKYKRRFPTKYHSHEAQSFLGSKTKTDEEQRTAHTPHMKQKTHKQRRTATEEPQSAFYVNLYRVVIGPSG